jgi:hypothetical protein
MGHLRPTSEVRRTGSLQPPEQLAGSMRSRDALSISHLNDGRFLSAQVLLILDQGQSARIRCQVAQETLRSSDGLKGSEPSVNGT